jgi:hypothetical protein
MIVSFAMLTIVAALAPVTLGRYDLTDHQVWALASALAWVGFAPIAVRTSRTRLRSLSAERRRPHGREIPRPRP